MPGMLKYRLLQHDNEADIDALYGLFQQAADYSLLVEGRLPTLQDARDELIELPPGKDLSDKFFGGFWMNDDLVGCAELIRGYPDPHIAYIGLMLFAATHQGQGLGVLAIEHLAELARSWQCDELRLAVIDKNLRALCFWQREGFRELYRKPVSSFTGDAIVMHKTLIGPSSK
jgi:GNAT superfamily N-acetyltransferase